MPMAVPKLTKLELQIMEALWTRGLCSIREIQESFPAKKRPAYTTVQTMVYRREVKKVLRRVKKIATANIFEARVSREAAEGRLIDEFTVAVVEFFSAPARQCPVRGLGRFTSLARPTASRAQMKYQ